MTAVAQQAAAVPQANPHGLMAIGAVAAHNIAAVLELPEDKVGVIEQAIKDEINAMSSHFTLAMRDVQDQYELEVHKLTQEKDEFITAAKAREAIAIAQFQKAVADIKSTFNYLQANKGKLALASGAIAFFGVLVGHFV